jgi:hypothetical protein
VISKGPKGTKYEGYNETVSQETNLMKGITDILVAIILFS